MLCIAFETYSEYLVKQTVNDTILKSLIIENLPFDIIAQLVFRNLSTKLEQKSIIETANTGVHWRQIQAGQRRPLIFFNRVNLTWTEDLAVFANSADYHDLAIDEHYCVRCSFLTHFGDWEEL